MARLIDENIDFFQYKKHNKPYIMENAHFHRKNELYYLEKGKTQYFVGNEIFFLTPGDLVFVPKGQFHKTISEIPGTERMLFVFDDEFAGEDFGKYIRELNDNKFVRISTEHLYKLSEIIRKIKNEEINKYQDYKTAQKLLFQQMLLLISRFRVKNAQRELSENHILMQNAAKYICRNYNTNLSLHTLSKKYNMSEGHFSKQFKLATGIRLTEYINIVRIDAAQKLLETTNKPITDIATECGFNDSNYFATVFKKIKGITPKKYSVNNSGHV